MCLSIDVPKVLLPCVFFVCTHCTACHIVFYTKIIILCMFLISLEEQLHMRFLVTEHQNTTCDIQYFVSKTHCKHLCVCFKWVIWIMNTFSVWKPTYFFSQVDYNIIPYICSSEALTQKLKKCMRHVEPSSRLIYHTYVTVSFVTAYYGGVNHWSSLTWYYAVVV